MKPSSLFGGISFIALFWMFATFEITQLARLFFVAVLAFMFYSSLAVLSWFWEEREEKKGANNEKET